MIYLDNAATSFPKPRSVYSAVMKTMKKRGGNPSRGSHAMARAASEAVYACREAASDLFGCDCDKVVLTYNATHALNLAIKGLAEKGSHILISDVEHNSVLRPVYALTRTHGCTFDIYHTYGGDEEKTVDGIAKLIRPDTRMVIANHASNICSIRLPVERIGELCRKRGITFIVDASQSAGHIPLNVRTMHVDAVCMAGHKGLYGPQGTGLLIFGRELGINTVLEGGAGVDSLDTGMPQYLPERLEAGTLSASLASGLAAGMRWLNKIGIETVADHERYLTTLLCEYLEELEGITVHGADLPLGNTVLFTHDRLSPADVAKYLDDNGICVRSGLHCAPLAHKSLGTGDDGAVRVSFGYFNTVSHVRQLALALGCI